MVLRGAHGKGLATWRQPSNLNLAVEFNIVDMDTIETVVSSNGKVRATVRTEGMDFIYQSSEYVDPEEAKAEAQRWMIWRDGVAAGEVDSIYYVVVVPETWAGPPPGAHAFSGLHYKIGRTNNIERRLGNLQTGTPGDLIVNALEPGGAAIERQRHDRFEADRRSGEWFSASPELCRFVFETWYRNNLLPPKHQEKMAVLAERTGAYRVMREVLGGAPDMVNPSINEPWYGKVFLDLVYSKLVRD